MMNWRFCPHCGVELAGPPQAPSSRSAQQPRQGISDGGGYDQGKHWRSLLQCVDALAQPPTPSEVLERLLSARQPAPSDLSLSSIVHVVMDRQVTPSGGALLQGVVSGGRLGPVGDVERLKQLGYTLENGRVKQVEGIPVGPAFLALQYWGGERQRHRWHLAQPIFANPSRHGDPYFMDDRFIAFGAVWRDLDRFSDAMKSLIETLAHGFDGVSAGAPLLLDVFWRTAPPRE